MLALARCRRGGSPRASPRAASSPRDALATPHPAKAKDRAPPPPPAAPRHATPRLASPCSTRTRTRSRRSRSLPRSNPPPEFRSRSQKVPTRTANRLDHRRWRFMKGCQEQCLIYHDIVRAREIRTRPTVPSRKRERERDLVPRALAHAAREHSHPRRPRKLTGGFEEKQLGEVKAGEGGTAAAARPPPIPTPPGRAYRLRA